MFIRDKLFVKPTSVNYYTVPFLLQNFSIINELKNGTYKKCEYAFGDLNVTNIIKGHKNIQFNNHNNIGFEPMDNPTLEKNMDTEAVWIRIPRYVTNFFQKIEEPLENSRDRKYRSYSGGMAFAIKSSAMMTTMSSDEDISTGIGLSDNGLENLIYIYDNFVIKIITNYNYFFIKH